jgi:hypothetical protein
LHITRFAMLLLDQVCSFMGYIKEYCSTRFMQGGGLKEALKATCDITIYKSPKDIGKKRTNIIALWQHYILVSVY